MIMTPDKVAVFLVSLAGLLTALAPAVADLDLNSTIGVVGGFLGIVGIVRKWLEGWQMFEERTQMGVPEEEKVPRYQEELPS
jgi:hypothetical protein